MWAQRLKELEETDELRFDTLPSEAGYDKELQDESLPADKYRKDVNFPFGEYKEAAGLAVSVGAVVGQLLISHPFVVLRRQCQVHSTGQSLHLLPFSILPVIKNLLINQGVGCFCKGLTSSFTVHGLILGIENLFSELYRLPKMIQFIILKSLAWALVSPVFASHLVECVQSDVASETPGIFSCLSEATSRLSLPRSFFRRSQRISATLQGDMSSLRRGFSDDQSSNSTLQNFTRSIKTRLPITTHRLLPIWAIVAPVVCLNVGHYIIRSSAAIFWSGYFGQSLLGYETIPVEPVSLISEHSAEEVVTRQERHETALQATYMKYYSELATEIWSSFVADFVLLPFETLVVRLCVQGTRTLIDNTDTGNSIVPVVSAYECLSDVVNEASMSPVGQASLFRGMGVLLLQYGVQLAFLHCVKYAYEQLLYRGPAQRTSPPLTTSTPARPTGEYSAPR